jgi:hypothetical protein
MDLATSLSTWEVFYLLEPGVKYNKLIVHFRLFAPKVRRGKALLRL